LKFGDGIRLTLLWLGASLFATGAGATNLQSANAGVSAPAAVSKATPARRAAAAARSRARTRAAAAKTRAAQRTLAEAKTPRYRVDADGNVVPDLRAAAAIIYDPSSGKVLWEEHSQDERSIASITKVMTAWTRLRPRPPTCGPTIACG
jgi:D-alanyl-D-alanine carboxypeptidase